MGTEPEPVVVALPRRVDRRMRLGPFPSARDALKFLGYSGLGLALSPVAGPSVWLPVLAGGFLLAAYRPEGRGLDERALEYLRFRFRSGRPRSSSAGGVAALGGSTASVRGGSRTRRGSVLVASGVPVRYLPPADARRLFDAYRDLLRSLGSPAHLRLTSEPLHAPAFLPEPREGEPSAVARAGYAEMIGLLLRRRERRRVVLTLGPAGGPTHGGSAGQADAGAVLQRLAALGVDAQESRGAATTARAGEPRARAAGPP